MTFAIDRPFAPCATIVLVACMADSLPTADAVDTRPSELDVIADKSPPPHR